MAQSGPQLQVEPDEPNEGQLECICEVEKVLGLALVAVRP